MLCTRRKLPRKPTAIILSDTVQLTASTAVIAPAFRTCTNFNSQRHDFTHRASCAFAVAADIVDVDESSADSLVTVNADASALTSVEESECST